MGKAKAHVFAGQSVRVLLHSESERPSVAGLPIHVLVGSLLFSGVARAQGAAGTWEVEVHGGMTQANRPSGGDHDKPCKQKENAVVSSSGTSVATKGWVSLTHAD